MVRIGIIGLESSRPRRFIAHLNAARFGAGADRIVAVVPSTEAEDGRVSFPAGLDLVPRVLRRPGDLVGEVDAVIDCTRDGALHRSTVEPLLAAGIHAFVDKPLATTGTDARALANAAATSGVALLSYSGYRRAGEIPELIRWLAATTGPRTVVISGPADPASEHSGLFYYGIHHVEIAHQLLGPVELRGAAIQVDQRPGEIVAEVLSGDTRVLLVFVAPVEGRDAPFTVTATSAAGLSRTILTVPASYNELMLDEFIRAAPLRHGPYPASDLIASVELLATISSLIE